MATNTKYLGLDLKSPVIAGSCGLTANVENLCKLEEAGAGAVVIKSVFEEQIIYDIKRNTHVMAPVGNYGASYEYIAQHVADDSLEKHFSIIRDAKSRLSIPVIGSVNCYSHENWLTYAKRFQESGCDALELNMAILPYETSLSADDVERTFNNIIQTLKKSVTIPISIKVGPYFTDMAKFMQQLSWTGIGGITLFNKSLEVDIDIDKEETTNASVLSAPESLYNTLRWTAILSKKLLLAGATTVQVASCLYRGGVEYMKVLNDGLEAWMQKKGYDSVDQFRGKLAVRPNETASMVMRTQFMHYFAEI